MTSKVRTVRLTDEQWERIRILGAMQGLSRAQYIAGVSDREYAKLPAGVTKQFDAGHRKPD